MNKNNEHPTLLHRFLHWEGSTPDAIYLTQPLPDGSVVDYSWREVGDQARRMAAYLVSLDLPPRSSIGIFGKNTAHWIIADLAIWMAGHISVPLYSTANTDTVGYVLQHAEVRLLFVGRLDGDAAGWGAVRAGVPAGLPLIDLPMSACGEGESWERIVAAATPLENVALPEPGELATIIYTSGSTGNPKGVMHSFGSMYNAPAVTGCMYDKGRGPQSGDRLLSYLPLAHTAERAVVEAVSLFSGCRVFFNLGLETFSEDLRRARPTIFLSMPRLWGKFYQGINERIPAAVQAAAFADPVEGELMKAQILSALGLDQVHTGLSGSAPLPVKVMEWYRQLGLELLEGYGMSENFGTSHFSLPGQVRVGYVGAAIPGVECRIGDNSEILVKSPAQMLGYYKQAELTAESYTADGLFRTGDRGELDEQGRLRITGRVKELFKTAKGKYVAPVPIEAKLGNHSRVEASCVTGVGLPQPLALLNVSPDTRATLASAEGRDAVATELEVFLAEVNAQFEPHEQLACLVVVREPWSIANGLLTPTLKIRRNLIEDRYQEMVEVWAESGCKVIFE
ncbi:AMP-binding protein [Pseudomonas sp. JS3066]|uniref:AMP-binding protein n=1 Tax=unclassified Pseudomonas TaxID=196821 RepID=UPI00129E669B|nr:MULTISPECIES: AMP-binding protein [unclassified Pseudomonas]MDH4656889.1 AMP-binding acetyl-CoA synthetase [Pseudomonas sp. BN606]MRK22147.1 AMP-binding protein [Pseudomonas sp. JG-B]WVK95273.1 AMP-binding protein [Pseudomonas sp. JS3066]